MGWVTGIWGKVIGVAAVIVIALIWLKNHDAARAQQIKEDTRVEMTNEIKTQLEIQNKVKQEQLDAALQTAQDKVVALSDATEKLNASSMSALQAAQRLKQANLIRLGSLPAQVAAIPDPQLEVEYRAALAELREEQP